MGSGGRTDLGGGGGRRVYKSSFSPGGFGGRKKERRCCLVGFWFSLAWRFVILAEFLEGIRSIRKYTTTYYTRKELRILFSFLSFFFLFSSFFFPSFYQVN